MTWLTRLLGGRKVASTTKTSDVAIVQADTGGKIRLWSDGAQALFGHTAAQAVGQSLELIVPPQFREAHWGGFFGAIKRKSLNGNDPFVLPILCRDGQVKHFAGRLTLLNDAYGEPVGALGVFIPESKSYTGPELYRL